MKNKYTSGERFGRLTIVGPDQLKPSGKHRRVICSCDCGVIKSVCIDHLGNGHVQSCGCYKSEMCINNLPAKYTEKKHGMSKTKLFQIYEAMVQRCHNPNKPHYPDYGGRGISVCSEWKHSPSAFLKWAVSSGYSEGLSIDRIDVNGNYCPENCRWVDNKTQMRNRRNTWKVSYCGEVKAVSEWCELLGLEYGTVASRLRRGRTADEAFELRRPPT